MDSEGLLSAFREQWKAELETQQHRNEAHSVTSEQDQCKPNTEYPAYYDKEAEAAELFRKGVQLEEDGYLYESIWYYRKAIGMVPDIEKKLCFHTSSQNDVSENLSNVDESLNEDTLTLVSQFESLFVDSQVICAPQNPQEAAHVSCLPNEMMDRILLWVAGEDLDLESVERLSMVSRGFYLLCRNQKLWRKACARVWGVKLGKWCSPFSSWRDMFVWRPRPRYNGCYVSRTAYYRTGENCFQDRQHYSPWHIVSYYRYFRFFPGGSVFMVTSSDEPQSVVGQLKTLSDGHPQAVRGHYVIHGSTLTILFEKRREAKRSSGGGGPYRRRQMGTNDVALTKLSMEFDIKEVRKRPNWQLAWRCYSVVSIHQSGSHTTSVVNVSDTSAFPPLLFSRVKSYTAHADKPLA